MERWTEGFVRANGIQMHYHRTGGRGPALVLVHGITDSGLCWQRFARTVESQFDVIMLDLRGHGQSDKPQHGYARTDYADDLAGFVGALDLALVHFIGHSLGAATAALMAARHPGIVGSIVMDEPSWMPDDTLEAAVRRRDTLLRWLHERKALSEEELIQRALARSWNDEDAHTWAAAQKDVSLNIAEAPRSTWVSWREIVESLRCPSLLITGDLAHGAFGSVGTGPDCVRLNSELEWRHFPDAGHNPRRTHFDEYLDVVTAFLRQRVGLGR